MNIYIVLIGCPFMFILMDCPFLEHFNGLPSHVYFCQTFPSLNLFVGLPFLRKYWRTAPSLFIWWTAPFMSSLTDYFFLIVLSDCPFLENIDGLPPPSLYDGLPPYLFDGLPFLVHSDGLPLPWSSCRNAYSFYVFSRWETLLHTNGWFLSRMSGKRLLKIPALPEG